MSRLIVQCDFCLDKYGSAIKRNYGSNFCTQECFKLFNRKIAELDERLNSIFNRTYAEKPE